MITKFAICLGTIYVGCVVYLYYYHICYQIVAF